MATYPLANYRTWVTGESVTATKMNTDSAGSDITISMNVVSEETTTTNNIPQWSNGTGELLKSGKTFTTDVDSGSVDDEIPSAKACYDGASALITANNTATNFTSVQIGLSTASDTSGLVMSNFVKSHGLGAVPSACEAYLHCVIAYDGWSVGDRVKAVDAFKDANDESSKVSWVFANATQVGWLVYINGNVHINLPSNKSGASEAPVPTLDKWEIVLTASI